MSFDDWLETIQMNQHILRSDARMLVELVKKYRQIIKFYAEKGGPKAQEMLEYRPEGLICRTEEKSLE